MVTADANTDGPRGGRPVTGTAAKGPADAGATPACGSAGTLLRAAVRSLILGAIVTVAVSLAGALRLPATTPEGEREVSAWLAPVPEGWPVQPWPTARHDLGWARETWELRGDPPRTPTGRARDFAAQWSLRCGWPLPAFSATRSRLRSLWGQGETFAAPADGPSASLSEGVVISAATFGGSEGQFIIPVIPMWGGLAVDTLVFALPFFALALISQALRRPRPAAAHPA